MGPPQGRWPGLWALLPRPHLGQSPTPPRGLCSVVLARALIGPLSLSSIVLVASKGRYVSRGPWTRVLEKLGADKGLKLKDKMVFVGFKGSFRPTWVTLATEDHQAKIFQVVPIPVVRKKRL
ncbi:PREDICTED: cell migration-inducing and hyaluronan-binding protein-like [Myotis brandtii]|uniref:cell migration-inducing and hyaluronan-binding protein-like n=1 Tax=Myotis brandtii TaxID=109478 RepID=UPI0007045EF8|nr:PREDICTED: cell migration-inducing and hyaluronan-binding protein-like [Myotis brandtii]